MNKQKVIIIGAGVTGLVAGIYLHLGRSPSSALYRATGLGADAGNGFQYHALGS